MLARISEIRAIAPPPAVGALQQPSPRSSESSSGFAAALAAAGRTAAATSVAPAPASWARLPVAPVAEDAPSGTTTTVGRIKAAWQNGRVPEAELVPLRQGGHRLAAPAAVAFADLETAARESDISLRVTDSYRSYEQQVDLVRRKGLYSQGGLAAQPGTSQHGWGLAVDLDLDEGAQAWMRANAARFGFAEDVPREPWQWTFRGR